MKLIKFDLPIDGVKVRTIDELREHFSVEILDHYQSGLLAKWLRVRSLTEELAQLSTLDGMEEHALLRGLCEVFHVEADDLVISTLLDRSPKYAQGNVAGLYEVYEKLAETIDRGVFQSLRLNCVVINKDTTPAWCYADALLKGDYCLRADIFSGASSAVPGCCTIIEKYPPLEDSLTGDILGWYLLSDHAEDYFNNWRNFFILQAQRIKAISGIAEQVSIPLLKKALNRRIELLEEIVHAFEEANGCSPQNPEHMLELLRSLPDEQRKMIFVAGTGIVEVMARHPLRNSYHMHQSEGELKNLSLNTGDRICANSVIATFGYENILSTASGVVREVLAKNGDAIKSDSALLRVDTSDR
jgi:hypothetical protein